MFNKFSSKVFFLLTFLCSCFLCKCGGNNANVNTKVDIALITDTGDIDDGSFNQSSWESIKKYGDEKKINYNYFRPDADSDDARLAQIELAVKKGASIIVCPGFKFANSVDIAQNKFENTHFILIDTSTSSKNVGANVVCIKYKMEYSGFLAGYSIAQDYINRDIAEKGEPCEVYGFGYCGGIANDGVYQFGFGYIQGIINGINDVVKEKKCKIKPLININFNYANVFTHDNRTTILMQQWFESPRNIKVIFSCGGKIYQSITEAISAYNKNNNIKNCNDRNSARWVGVDTDQYLYFKENTIEKNAIFTSALKDLNKTLITAFDYHFNNNWDEIGGPYKQNEDNQINDETFWFLGLNSDFGRGKNIKIEKANYVGIPVATNDNSDVLRGFNNFTKKQLDEIKEKIIKNKYKVYSGFNSEKDYWGNVGDPSFMNKNENNDENKEVKYKKFLKEYLNNYDNFNILVQ